jgi:hypothetical protein
MNRKKSRHRPRRHLISWFAALGSFLPTLSLLANPADRADDLWTQQVQPLLDHYCFRCHGGVRQKSGLDLRALNTIMRGGDRGPAITPGSAADSHLCQFVLPGADPHMPLDEKKQLKDDEVAVLRSWIDALPSTNVVHYAGTNTSEFAEAYTKAFLALKSHLWTPPEGLAAHEVVDGFIERGWQLRQIPPSPPSNDRTFCRRLYLDLAGRIPKPDELNAFVADQRPDKRARLTDCLLASDDYPRHLREVFDVVLLERRDEAAENRRREQGWFAYLERAFRLNYPWDRIVRDLIVARPSDPEDRGAAWYLYERKDNYQALAEAVAPIAFGVQIGCAQCHNHPLTAEIEQRHYWGLVAGFNRSKNADCASGPEVGESAIGGFINFANLKKESQPAELVFLNGRVVREQRPAEGTPETDAPGLYLIPPAKDKETPAHAPVPKFSRRAAMAEAITHDNPRLALAFVNRVWEMLMGQGLVHPVDQMDARHPPSHPDLLAWLGQAFEARGYDIKWLVRELVLSRTYQLDSRPASEPVPRPEAFARMLEKPLSAEQLYRSILAALGDPTDGTETETQRELRRACIARFPDLFPVEYNASLQQATFLSNSPILEKLLKSRESSTVARLLATPSAEERVRLAFSDVLGREPEKDELDRCRSFLEQHEAEAGIKELVWALLAGAEFQLNH